MDGSCRDVNFTPLTLGDCHTIVGRIFSQSQSGTATDGNGDQIELNASSFVSVGASTAHARVALENVADLFTHFQCFVCVDTGGPFLELTFFPDDVVPEGDPLIAVIQFLRNICVGTTVTEYFVRFENASWSFGDTAAGSGVIFTRSDVATFA